MSQIVKAFFCLISVWIIAAATLPLTQDEAYYTLWGEALRWGYFDHPPFVAFLTSFRVFFDSNSLWYQSPLSSRIGAVVAASLHFWIVFCLYRLWGIRDKKLLLVSLLLVSTNFLGLLFGVITTPDTGLILFWSLSLLAASRALAGQRMFWLLTGFFVGCGLL